MAAGPKRHRLCILKDDGTDRDTSGEHTPAWETVATVWAEGGPLRGDEVFAARQAQVEVTHRFKCRWGSSIDDLRGDVRVVLLPGGKVLHLLTATNADERGREIQLDCKEAPDGGRAVLDPAGSPILAPGTGDLIRG